MITKKLLMAGMLAVAVLAGCGDGIDTGTVTKKEFNPAYTVPRQQCMGYNPITLPSACTTLRCMTRIPRGTGCTSKRVTRTVGLMFRPTSTRTTR